MYTCQLYPQINFFTTGNREMSRIPWNDLFTYKGTYVHYAVPKTPLRGDAHIQILIPSLLITFILRFFCQNTPISHFLFL